jgi:hypothetical protein
MFDELKMTKEQNSHTARLTDFNFPDVTKEGLPQQSDPRPI